MILPLQATEGIKASAKALDQAFDVSIALGVSLLLLLITFIGLYLMWRFYTRNDAKVTKNHRAEIVNIIRDHKTELADLNKELRDTKEHTVETLRDVANILDKLEEGLKDTKTDIIKRIDETKDSIHQKIDFITK